MKRLKVLHVISAMDLGGAEKLTRLTVEGLPRDRFDAAVCSLRSGGYYVEQLRASGVPVFELLPAHVQRWKRPLPVARIAWRLWHLLRRERPDIVHFHLASTSTLGRFVALLAGRMRLVVTLHRVEYPRAQPILERLLSPMTTLYITDSFAAKGMLVSQLGIESARIATIHNGIDRAEFAAPPTRQQAREELALAPDDHVVGIIAHLYREKGHEFLLDALARVSELVPRLKLLVVGDGYLRKPLEAQARRLLPSGTVRFLGQRGDLPRLLAALDVLALPSAWEGFGIILAEAMFMRVPVVTTRDGGGCAEVVADEDGGLLVKFGDVAALAEALRRILSDDAYRRLLGDRGRARVERLFDAAQMSARYADVYERVVSA